MSGSTALHLCHRAPPALMPVLLARVPTKRCRRLPDTLLRVRHSTDPAPRRFSGGLLCQQPKDAVLDIIQVASPTDAKGWLDWALQRSILTQSDIAAAIARLERVSGGTPNTPLRRSTVGAHAITRLRLALEYARGGTRSEAERILRALLQRESIVGFVGDVPVSSQPGERPFARLDFAHVPLKIAIEVDGRAFHTSSKDFERDRERQNQLVAVGWLVLRVTWSMINEDPGSVVRDIHRAMRLRATPAHRNQNDPSKGPF